MSERGGRWRPLARVAVSAAALLLGGLSMAQACISSSLNTSARSMLEQLRQMNDETEAESGTSLAVADQSTRVTDEIRAWTAEMVSDTESLLPGLEGSVEAARRANDVNARALQAMDELAGVLGQVGERQGDFIELTKENVQLNGITMGQHNARFASIIHRNIEVLDQMNAQLDQPLIKLYFGLRALFRQIGLPLPPLGL